MNKRSGMLVPALLVWISMILMTVPGIAQGGVEAQIPNCISYQGYLEDKTTGYPIDVPVDITFTLYTSGGTQVWSEFHGNVKPDEGLFTVILGASGSPIYASHLDGDMELGIEVGNDGEMVPRQKVSAIAYSLRSQLANRAFGLNAPDGTPEDAVYVDNDGNVGIGTTNPNTSLHMTGNINTRILLEGTNDGQLILGESDAAADEKYFHVTSSGDSMSMGWINDALNGWGNVLTVNRDSEVGIGTTDPTNILHVKKQSGYTDGYDGAFIDIENFHSNTDVTSGIRFKNGNETNTTKGAIFYQDKLSNGRGDILFANDSADSASNVLVSDTKMVIKNSGNVGIGTPDPSTKLEVSGTVMASAIVSTGNLGIGTTAPVEELHIAGDSYTRVFAEGSYISQLILGDSDATTNEKYFQLSSTGEQFYIGGIADNLGSWNSSQFVMNRAGDVGIGTSDPSSKLEVSGDITVTGTVDGRDVSVDGAKLDGISSGAADTTNDSWTGMGDIYTTSGNVGIGTSSPGELLDLETSGAAWISLQRGTNQHGGLLFKETGASDTQWIFPYFRGWQSDNLIVRDEVANLDVMTFEANTGEIGIGNNSPAAELDINGDLKVSGAYFGDIGPNNGAPFPRPAYDSGWFAISPVSFPTTLNHNIGGNPDNYFVDMQFKGRPPISPAYSGTVTHNYGHGGDYSNLNGIFWTDLTSNTIGVVRENYNTNTSIEQVRIRIWVYN